MTYVDVTLTPEATYSFVNARQVYDVVAGAMTTHPAWDFVEFKDATNGPTYRRYVWKCTAAQSGLSADFYVVFEVPFVTTNTVWATNQTIRVWMGETYSAGVLGKFATNNTSVTLASDLTNPATFTLTTFALPGSLLSVTNRFGLSADTTSLRIVALVAKDSLVLTRAANASGTAGTANLLYVGAYDSLMAPAVDPLPIIILGTSSSSSPFPGGGATRAPTMTPATAYADVFAVQAGGSSVVIGVGGWSDSLLTNSRGTLGSAADTAWFKNMGGIVASRLIVFPGCVAASCSTLGLLRGHLKNVWGAVLATHSYGDTFLVDGKVCVGTGTSGQAAVINTEAA